MKTSDRLPSIIILWTMEQHITREVTDLADKKIAVLLQNEIQAILKANIYDDEIDLQEQVYENVSMGILMGDEKYTTPFRLLYRTRNNLEFSRSKKILACELLKWIESQETMEFLMQKIYQCSIIVTKQLQQVCVREQKANLEERNGNHNTRINNHDFGHAKRIRKNVHSSPASTDKSQQRYDRNADEQVELSRSAEDPIEESDLFEVLKNRFSTPSCKQEYLDENNPPKYEQKCQLFNDQKQLNYHNVNEDSLMVKNEARLGRQEQNRKDSEDSVNQAGESEPHGYTLLRLTDEHHQNEDGEDNLMSEVSSFARESDFLNINIYELQDTSKYGHLLYGDKIDKILRNFMSQESNFLLIKWLPRKNGFVPLESILETAILKEHCPRILIQFYEQQFKQ